jgi:hypothetical protein
MQSTHYYIDYLKWLLIENAANESTHKAREFRHWVVYGETLYPSCVQWAFLLQREFQGLTHWSTRF